MPFFGLFDSSKVLGATVSEVSSLPPVLQKKIDLQERQFSRFVKVSKKRLIKVGLTEEGAQNFLLMVEEEFGERLKDVKTLRDIKVSVNKGRQSVSKKIREVRKAKREERIADRKAEIDRKNNNPFFPIVSPSSVPIPAASRAPSPSSQNPSSSEVKR